MVDSAKTAISREMALDLLARRQQRKQREALEALRRHFAHGIGSFAAASSNRLVPDPTSLIEVYKQLDQIAVTGINPKPKRKPIAGKE